MIIDDEKIFEYRDLEAHRLTWRINKSKFPPFPEVSSKFLLQGGGTPEMC